MPRPDRRLDLVLVPADPEACPVEEARSLLEDLVRQRIIDDDGRPGPEAARWSDGGFARIRVDAPGAMVLYANQSGGFRVSCPACGANVVPAFNRALTEMRAGGSREVTCGCGSVRPLEDLHHQPPAALGRMAIVTSDVGRPALEPDAMARVQAALGPVRTVLRRP